MMSELGPSCLAVVHGKHALGLRWHLLTNTFLIALRNSSCRLVPSYPCTHTMCHLPYLPTPLGVRSLPTVFMNPDATLGDFVAANRRLRMDWDRARELHGHDSTDSPAITCRRADGCMIRRVNMSVHRDNILITSHRLIRECILTIILYYITNEIGGSRNNNGPYGRRALLRRTCSRASPRLGLKQD